MAIPLYLQERNYDRDPILMERITEILQEIRGMRDDISDMREKNSGILGRLDERMLDAEQEIKKHSDEISELREKQSVAQGERRFTAGKIAGGAAAVTALCTAFGGAILWLLNHFLGGKH